MDVTRTVPGMERMPEFFLLSEILTGFFQLIVIIGFALLLLVFIYRGQSTTEVNLNFIPDE